MFKTITISLPNRDMMNENSINLIMTLSVEDLSKFEHDLCRTHIKPK